MKENIDWWLSFTEQRDDCLLWTRCINTDGYPRAVYKGNFNGKVHRIVYALANPEVDISNKVIRHSCDTPRCINPNHLLVGTPKDNAVDREVRNRNPNSRLTASQVTALRTLYSTGKYTQKDLGTLFNVSSSAAQSAISRTSYQWVQ